MKTDGSKALKSTTANIYCAGLGGNTPPVNKDAMLPKNRNMPFLKRFMKWWTQ